MQRKNEYLSSIVIPCYNSQHSIAELVARIKEVEHKVDGKFQIILVNDCSTDNTIEVLKSLIAKFDDIKVVDMLFNVGQFMATICGFEYAEADYVITMDDDLQHPPEEIPKLISAMNASNDHDIIYGVFHEKKHHFIRNFGSWLVNWIDRIVFNKPKGLQFTAFRMVRKEITDALVEHHTMYPLIDPLLLKISKKVKNVYVSHEKRKYGKSNYNALALIRITLNHVFNFSTLPLKIISFAGLIVFIASILVSFYYLMLYFTGNISVPGWVTNVLLINFFGGLILFTLGIIGQYLIRIMYEVKGFPRYKVRKTYP
jgi:glycosyltransferase involved in cell wall biosynthesis